MRTISSDALARLATKEGYDPICIIAVEWSEGKILYYADRTVEGIPGKITQLGELDNIVDVSNNSTSQQIQIVLDDVDRTIRDIMNQNDVHQANAWVYQYFDGLDLDDKFLLFRGKLESPIVWSEGDRTVSFNITSQIEDKEIGFSAEEGEFPLVPKDMIGQAWPIIFGTVLDVPVVQANKAVTGTTLCGVGIIEGEALQLAVPDNQDDCGFLGSISEMQAQQIHALDCAIAWEGTDSKKAAQFFKQSEDLAASISQAVANHNTEVYCSTQKRQNTLTTANQTGLGCNPVRILGGEDFPQHKPISINIGGGVFTGVMNGDNFTISSRKNADLQTTAQSAFDSGTTQPFGCANDDKPPKWDLTTEIPCGKQGTTSGGGGNNAPSGGQTGGGGGASTGGGTGTAGSGGGSGSAPGANTNNNGNAPVVQPKTCNLSNVGFVICFGNQASVPNTDQVAQHEWYEPGTQVSMASDEPITFIVSIVPGTVLAVKAYKTLSGQTKLVNVPNDLWTVATVNYGPVMAVQVTVKRPLSTIKDQGWQDQIYVTFQSSVGPATTDILEYIIEQWTSLDFDSDNFDAIAEKLAPFPMNFPILDRKNVLEVIKDIAFQARCGIWLEDGIFKMKYLPEEPDSDDTITVSDIAPTSMEIELTATEDLVTKMNVTWHLSWANGNNEIPNKIILRHNVEKYGTKEQDYDFYCYNQPDIVLKSATFWLIRLANTWKKFRFKTYVQKLNLEGFDCVTVPGGYVSNSDCKAIVSTASYDSSSNTIAFECMAPVKSGKMEPYIFYWPADVSEEFPTVEDIQDGAISGVNTIGVLPIGDTSQLGSGGTIFVGGPNVVFRANSSVGDRSPGDVGFTAQAITATNTFANITNVQNPRPNLKLNYRKPTKIPRVPHLIPGAITIDIHSTKFIDSAAPGTEVAYMKSLVREIKDGNMYLHDKLNVEDDNKNLAFFELKYDDKGKKFGAERAFLADDSDSGGGGGGS